MKPLPLITEELLSYLERLYPDIMPMDEVSLTTTSRMQGRVDVVRHLRSVYEQQLSKEITYIGENYDNVLRQPRSPAAPRSATAASANLGPSGSRYSDRKNH